MPGILLGDVFPNFEANTTAGKIKFHEFLGNSWGILFSHPRDFTPVCTTELACAARISDEFKKRDVKMIALSIDSVEDHLGWSKVFGGKWHKNEYGPMSFTVKNQSYFFYDPLIN